MKTQRIRDPIHDLIEFNLNDDLEKILWSLLDTRPFQRLRRVKQLGFSDFVYPGACHSRFSHSIGVFHTARQLIEVLKSLGVDGYSKAHPALAAALLHDVGHGPFSHAFEDVGDRLGLEMAHHEELSSVLIREGEISEKLKAYGRGFADDVADIIKKNGVKTIQHAVVSSQFDADRLDYIRRDRMMTGTQHAAIDFRWLMANLEVGSVNIGVDDEQTGAIDTFVLGPKAIHAAEAYVLGLFQLYPTVYFHKTTRGVEKVFTELMVRVIQLVRDGNIQATGLSSTHPLVAFANDSQNVDKALALDDAVIWGALPLLTEGTDPCVSEFSRRLRDRKLLKCIDIRNHVQQKLNPKGDFADGISSKIDECCASIRVKLLEWDAEHTPPTRIPRLLVDRAERSPYKAVNESKGPLDRINIRPSEGALVDLRERSQVIQGLQVFKLTRVYRNPDDREATAAISQIVEREIGKCRAN